MKYLLDTDVLINHFRGKEAIKFEIITSGMGISIITLGELLYGAYKSSTPQKNLIKLEQDLTSIEVVIEDLNGVVMKKFAEIKAYLEKKGTKLEDFDLLIGATAIVNGLILVTGNIKHFKRIQGLKIET